MSKINYPVVDPDEYNQTTKLWLPGYVYVLDQGAGTTFKIGYTTKTPEKRLAELSMGDNVIMPMHLVMSVYTDTNAYFLENIIQMSLDAHHNKGEWFDLDFQELVGLHQTMAHFGHMKTYDRWFKIVPKNYMEYMTKGYTSPRYPKFTTKEQENWNEIWFQEVEGWMNGN